MCPLKKVFLAPTPVTDCRAAAMPKPPLAKLHRFWKQVGDVHPRLAKSAVLYVRVPRRQENHVGTGAQQLLRRMSATDSVACTQGLPRAGTPRT